VLSKTLAAEYNLSLVPTRLVPIGNARSLEHELPEQKPRPKSIASSMIVEWLQMLVLLQSDLEMLPLLDALLHTNQL